MRHFYKDPVTGEKYEYDSVEAREHYGAPRLVVMTQSEIDEHLNSTPTYSQALAKLNAAYQTKIDGFNRQFALAALADGPSEEGKKLSIRADYEAAKTQHAANIAQLKKQYGIGV